jgi:hypothetical protein
MDQVMRDVEKRGKKWTQVKQDGMGRQGQMEISL